MNLLQIPMPADTVQAMYNSLSSAEVEAVKMSAFELAQKGGWLMYVLLILLLMSIYVLIERSFVINIADKEDHSFMNRIKDYIHDGKIEAATTLCRQTDTPYARMVEKGVSRLGRPTADVMSAIENQGNIEISKLEADWPLATSARVHQWWFPGTVTGMVRAFMTWRAQGLT